MDNGTAHASDLNQTDMTLTGTHPRDTSSITVEPPHKRIKAEPSDDSATARATSTCETAVSEEHAASQAGVESADVGLKPSHNGTAPQKADHSESSIVTSSSGASNSSASNTSLHDNTHAQAAIPASNGPVPNPTEPAAAAPAPVAAAAPSTKPPLKATTMDHLRTKYLGELEYMLREFRKLERQLLGAKGAAQLEESAGSRERREKLHSFILHLEDTVRQIEVGCTQEDAEKEQGDEATKNNPTKEADDEENVQKLEEHILANLLPVKIRLKKQLAAQQGATRNPPGMPAPRRGSLQPSSAALGKGTFAAAAEERQKQAEAARLAAEQEERATRRVSDPTQFGKPLGGGGSSLTQKLHGATLGSSTRTFGHGVGSSAASPATGESKILYAGMVPQSKQHQSSLNAASGVHELIVEDPNFVCNKPDVGEPDKVIVPKPNAAQSSIVASGPQTTAASPKPVTPKKKDPPSPVPALMTETYEKRMKPHEDITLSEEERRRLRKKRRKRKLRRIAKRREKERQRQVALHQQAQAAQGSAKSAAGRKKSASSKPQGKKKGPKSVEYMCALCSEAYSSTCDYNPWWALAQHDCPKCRKSQIPRIDISAPANAIDYHPALLAHADDNNSTSGGGGGSAGAATNVHVVHVAQSPSSYKTPPMKEPQIQIEDMYSDSESDLSELSDGSLSDDSLDSDDDSSLDFQLMSQAEQAEHESFGHDYQGPVLSDEDASRLLVLMAHASTCPCNHKLTKHRDVCKSTKFMMLHVRDCPGTTASFDVCPFPWCRKVKHLLFHLVSCVDPESCDICSPTNLSDSLKGLTGLNEHRVKKHRQRLIAATKASNTVRPKGAPAPNTRPVTQKPSARKASDISKTAAAKAKVSTSPKLESKATKSAPVVQVPLEPCDASPAPPAIAKQPNSAETIEITGIAQTVKTEFDPENSPSEAVQEQSKPSVEAALQQDPSPTSPVPVVPETSTDDHIAVETPEGSTDAPGAIPTDIEMPVASESLPAELTIPNDTSATPAVDQSAIKMEIEEEVSPPAATATATAIDTPAPSAVDENNAAESAPTIKMDSEEAKPPTPVANHPVEEASATAPSATATATATAAEESSSPAIKEELERPDGQEKASTSPQTCTCPPGEVKQCVDHKGTTTPAIAMDADLTESEASPVETEEESAIAAAAAVAAPIRTQASSEALKIAC